jgi:hypothetical protein
MSVWQQPIRVDRTACSAPRPPKRAHQRQPQRDLSWKFHDVSEPLRCDHVIMYEPIGRHLWNENNMYAFGAAYPIRREMKEADNMFANPLPVPDVHKLRYMSNNYMTPDDWLLHSLDCYHLKNDADYLHLPRLLRVFCL